MLAVFEIGGTRMRAAASPAPGMLGPLAEVPTPADDLEAFAAAMRGLLPEGARGIAVSAPGGAAPGSGRLRVANVGCLDGRTVDDLAQALRLPVVLGNDADCFALAEATEGAGVGHRVVFGVILGTGAGGGLVIDGRLHAGAFGLTGEWGHGPVFPTVAAGREVPAFRCGCSQSGCVETVGGARGIERLHRHLHGQASGAEAVLADWAAGRAAAVETLAVWAAAVAGPLALVLNVIGPSAVPVGGGLARAAGLVPHLDAAVRARVLHDPGPGLLRPALVGDEPGLTGAAVLGWQMLQGGGAGTGGR